MNNDEGDNDWSGSPGEIGTVLGIVEALRAYSQFSPVGNLLLCLLMLIGRA